MNKKDVILGFIIGVIANLIGIVIYILLLSKEGFIETITSAIENRYLGKLISIGAILNLLVFFFFIRKKEDNKVRGVLSATLMTAISIIINKV